VSPFVALCIDSGKELMLVTEQMTERKNPSSHDPALEADLIARVLQGEKEVFYELIRAYEKSVYLTAFSVLQNSGDAEEVSQEAILKAFRHLADFRGESRFGTWLVKIALNEARMHLRKQHRHMWESMECQNEEDESDYVPEEFGDWREIPSEALERKEIRDLLSNAVAALPEIYREVIALRDIRQMSVAETAEVLGVRKQVVKTRLLRARLRLRDMVAPFTTSRGLFSRNPFRRGTNPWF
jgi:RNA polymerase sigma-70 factor (ECF subfamily)